MSLPVHIGTSGWSYDHWQHVFYPEDCRRSQWLAFYTGHFTTVELNASFYRLPTVGTFENWRLTTPAHFIWAVKASRYITHIKRLHDPADSLARFFEAVRLLQEKLGPVLFQLPPTLAFDENRAREFFSALAVYAHRCALEVRHASWLEDRPLTMLSDFNIALCISDTAGRHPYCDALTADFAYVRLHGSRHLYGSNYFEDELVAWAEKIRTWSRETFVYFDNDFRGYAPRNALRMKEILAPAE
jgi:uncharacterized protein YecE (DUF72 family)